MIYDPSHPVRAVAELDFRADIVDYDERRIDDMARPADLKGLEGTLEGSPLGSHITALVPYFIVMNTMNFQFWAIGTDNVMQRYTRDGLVGALAMQAAFQRAWEEAGGQHVFGPGAADQLARVVNTMRSRIERDGAQALFGDIPAARGRTELLLEVLDSQKLQAVSDFIVARCQAGELGWGEAQLLASLFPRCYGDRYLKKAQLTLMFIAGDAKAAQGEPLRLNVTACADYQLPKVLRSLGLLVYGPLLARAVDNGELIREDGKVERALRAATVKACDMLAARFQAGIPEVDFWLWLNRNQARDAKFHLTHTTAY